MLFQALLMLHVAFAGVALAAGDVALLAPKGGATHRRSGLVFVASMLAMTAIALVIALMRRADISIVPSMLSFYLVATGWLTLAHRPPSERLDLALTVLALAAAAAGFALGVTAVQHASEGKASFAPVHFVFGALALLGAGLDGWRRLKPLASRGARLARHLWRMGLALLIATSSFFQGQEQVFPKALQGTWLLKAPALIVLALLLVWMVRLALRKGPRPLASATRRSAASA